MVAHPLTKAMPLIIHLIAFMATVAHCFPPRNPKEMNNVADALLVTGLPCANAASLNLLD